jgi:hypothetical protein
MVCRVPGGIGGFGRYVFFRVPPFERQAQPTSTWSVITAVSVALGLPVACVFDRVSSMKAHNAGSTLLLAEQWCGHWYP